MSTLQLQFLMLIFAGWVNRSQHLVNHDLLNPESNGQPPHSEPESRKLAHVFAANMVAQSTLRPVRVASAGAHGTHDGDQATGRGLSHRPSFSISSTRRLLSAPGGVVSSALLISM